MQRHSAHVSTDQINARNDVAPLIAATDLQETALILSQAQKIHGLQQHVAEFRVGNTLLRAKRDFTESR